MKPPRSSTTAGTAVARIVASIATRPMLSITASRIGPRSLRRPTSARLIAGVEVTSDGNRGTVRHSHLGRRLSSRADARAICVASGLDLDHRGGRGPAVRHLGDHDPVQGRLADLDLHREPTCRVSRGAGQVSELRVLAGPRLLQVDLLTGRADRHTTGGDGAGERHLAALGDPGLGSLERQRACGVQAQTTQAPVGHGCQSVIWPLYA